MIALHLLPPADRSWLIHGQDMPKHPISAIPVAGIPHPYPERNSETENDHVSAASLRRNFHSNFTAWPAVQLVRPSSAGRHAHLPAVRIVRITARKLISDLGKPACRTHFANIACGQFSTMCAHTGWCGPGTAPRQPGKLSCRFIRMAQHAAHNAVVSLLRHSAQISSSSYR